MPEDTISRFVVLRFNSDIGPQQWVVPKRNVLRYLFAKTPSYLVLPLHNAKTGIVYTTFQQQRVILHLHNGTLKLGPKATLRSVDTQSEYEVYRNSCDLTADDVKKIARMFSVKKKLARCVAKIKAADTLSLPHL